MFPITLVKMAVGGSGVFVALAFYVLRMDNGAFLMIWHSRNIIL
jgi:hypothetical protein